MKRLLASLKPSKLFKLLTRKVAEDMTGKNGIPIAVLFWLLVPVLVPTVIGWYLADILTNRP